MNGSLALTVAASHAKGVDIAYGRNRVSFTKHRFAFNKTLKNLA